MSLNEDQLKSVAAWFAGGASLDEIQKRLVAEFGVHLTYFDLRMIVADLPQPEEGEEATGETPVDPESRQDGGSPEDGALGERALPGEDATGETPVAPDEPEAADAQERVPSALSVTVDALMIPGTMASGDVTFSDGVKGKWYLDQMGRLGLGGDLPQGYRPSPADAALFQARLMEALRAKGLC